MKPIVGHRCPRCRWSYDGRERLTCPNCKTTCKQSDKGIGDTIARLIYCFDRGLYKRIFKRCGCNKRQWWLNELWQRLLPGGGKK